MKKKLDVKRLVLKREVLRELTSREGIEAAGGASSRDTECGYSICEGSACLTVYRCETDGC